MGCTHSEPLGLTEVPRAGDGADEVTVARARLVATIEEVDRLRAAGTEFSDLLLELVDENNRLRGGLSLLALAVERVVLQGRVWPQHPQCARCTPGGPNIREAFACERHGALDLLIE